MARNLLKSSWWGGLHPTRLKKTYVVFSIFYGVTSLIVPFAAQYLVNNLALSGIWANMVSFSLILGVTLAVSQLFKYCQTILNEYIQREVYLEEIRRWSKEGLGKESPYIFEIMNLMKSMSLAFTHMTEFALLTVFGFIVILIFHPAFILLVLILAAVIWALFVSWDQAIATSIGESNEKYSLFFAKNSGASLSDAQVEQYLYVREKHFHFIKRNMIFVGIGFVGSHLLLLGLGIYFVNGQQLSIGQLVSAEIILTGILTSLSRLPKTIESLYDVETSKLKIKKALRGDAHE
jgi:putative ABC transport system ATP-binding protein